MSFHKDIPQMLLLNDRPFLMFPNHFSSLSRPARALMYLEQHGKA